MDDSRDHFVFATVLGILVLILAPLVIIYALTDFEVNNTIGVGDIFIGVSILAVLFTAIVSIRRAKESDRLAKEREKRTHTFNLLAQATFSPPLTESLIEMAKMNNRGYVPEIEESEGRGLRIDEETQEHLIRVLNFYEFLAITWKQDDTKESVLYRTRGHAAIKTFDTCRGYIDEQRDIFGDELYTNFEEFVERCEELKERGGPVREPPAERS